MLKLISNLILPNRCFCNQIIPSADLVCQKCWNKIDFIPANGICECCGDIFPDNVSGISTCARCINEEIYYENARSVFKYNSVSEKLITGLKYSDRTPYVKILSQWLANKLPSEGDFDLITSVPLHAKSLRNRTYNQSALLSNSVARKCNIPVNNRILLKLKNTPPQASLSKRERLTNIKNAFIINPKFINIIKDKKILLIDDVFTTGSTVNECARILKKSGVMRVNVLTPARTPLED